MQKEITVALAGNPNSGKTTVFNDLTGAHQHVGNWPGVTVERKEGSFDYQGYRVRVVDLPGVYSLTAFSPDETVARNFILEGKPDIVVNVVDASNLERNLYLSVQLLELEVNLVLALNMMDVAGSRKYDIDVDRLALGLGVAVVPMVASRKEGHDELLKAIIHAFRVRVEREKAKIRYASELEMEISELAAVISQTEPLSQRFPARWLAIKLLEGDREMLGHLGIREVDTELLEEVKVTA